MTTKSKYENKTGVDVKAETADLAALEHDVATGVTPDQDPNLAGRIEADLAADPSFAGKTDTAIRRGAAEWAKSHPDGEPSPETADMIGDLDLDDLDDEGDEE